MKEEIKVRNLTQQAIDVLNDLKNLKPGEEYEAGMPVDIMANTLLDYITNLQEENKNLKQINEEHRELNGNLRTANNTLCEVEEFMYNQAEDYKTRNEKAINCINHYATENDDYSKLYSTEEEELLEILQGSDE